MKKPILFLTILFSVTLLHAQTAESRNFPLSNEDFFTKSELVFEGHFVKYVESYDTKGESKLKDYISIIEYKVQRVYKGDQSLTGKVVYRVLKGSALGLENSNNTTDSYWRPPIFTRNGINQAVSTHSLRIFFFVASDIPDNENSKYFSHQKYKRLSDCFEGRVNDNMHVCGDKILGLDNLVFHQREDFYNYMRQFERFTVPEVEPLPEIKQEKVPEQENTPQIDSLQLQYNPIMDSLYRVMYGESWKEHKKKVQKNSNEYNTLTLEIAQIPLLVVLQF